MTWLVVANLAFSGLLVSWVMKFADSIVKVYATSMAMLLTAGVWARCARCAMLHAAGVHCGAHHAALLRGGA